MDWIQGGENLIWLTVKSTEIRNNASPIEQHYMIANETLY